MMTLFIFFVHMAWGQVCVNPFQKQIDFIESLQSSLVESGCGKSGEETKSFNEVTYGSTATTVSGLLFKPFQKEPIFKLQKDISKYISRRKCADSCEQINSADIDWSVAPVVTLEQPICDKPSLSQQSPTIVKSPIFKDKNKDNDCAGPEKQLSAWVEAVARGSNSEGKRLDQEGGDNCSYYMSQTTFTFKKINECQVYAQLNVRFGAKRANFQFKSSAKVTHKWICSLPKNQESQ